MKNKRNYASVTVLGLGKMGTAISRILLKEDFQVTTWNRTREKSYALESEGASSAVSIEDAIIKSEVIIISLLDYPSVDALLRPVENLMTGKLIINLTNGSPMQACKTAAYMLSAGARYLDGGIMAIPQMLGQREALLLFSGSEEAFRINEVMLTTLGTCKFISKEPGLAALSDLALLTAMYGMYSGYLQGVALIKSAGISASAFTPMATQWLQAMSKSLSRMSEAIDGKTYTDNVGASLSMQASSFENLVDTYQTIGIPIDLILPLKKYMESTVAKGYADANFSAVFETIKGSRP